MTVNQDKSHICLDGISFYVGGSRVLRNRGVSVCPLPNRRVSETSFSPCEPNERTFDVKLLPVVLGTTAQCLVRTEMSPPSASYLSCY